MCCLPPPWPLLALLLGLSLSLSLSISLCLSLYTSLLCFSCFFPTVHPLPMRSWFGERTIILKFGCPFALESPSPCACHTRLRLDAAWRRNLHGHLCGAAFPFGELVKGGKGIPSKLFGGLDEKRKHASNIFGGLDEENLKTSKFFRGLDDKRKQAAKLFWGDLMKKTEKLGSYLGDWMRKESKLPNSFGGTWWRKTKSFQVFWGT